MSLHGGRYTLLNGILSLEVGVELSKLQQFCCKIYKVSRLCNLRDGVVFYGNFYTRAAI